MFSKATAFKHNLRLQQELHAEALHAYRRFYTLPGQKDEVGFSLYLLGTALKDNILLALI